VHLAIVGKGGAGKSLIAGTLARLLAREGRRVLALDSDTLPGLEFSLGARPPAIPPLLDAAERGPDGRWGLKPGIGPVRAVARYATDAPDGVRLLQAGKVDSLEGTKPIMPALQAFYRVIHRLPRAPAFREWALVGDLPAGPRQAAYDWAPYAGTYVVVVEPTMQSLLAARRIARIVTARSAATLTHVANKVRVVADVERIEDFLGVRVAVAVPIDPAVTAAERAGVALLDLDPGAAVVGAVRELVAALDRFGAPAIPWRDG
jgi:CO dehydrogenase maturation factor